MKDRIKQLMESQHMNQLLFSQYIGISSASLSSIFNGRTNPSLKTVDAIRKRFPNLNIDWLMFGEGQMFWMESQAKALLLLHRLHPVRDWWISAMPPMWPRLLSSTSLRSGVCKIHLKWHLKLLSRKLTNLNEK